MPANPLLYPPKDDPIQQVVDQLNADIARRAYRLRQHHAHAINARFTQLDLAKACNLRQQAISKLERGEYRRSEFLITCIKVATFFGEKPALFIFGHPPAAAGAAASVVSESALDIARKWETANETVKDIITKLLGPLT